MKLQIIMGIRFGAFHMKQIETLNISEGNCIRRCELRANIQNKGIRYDESQNRNSHGLLHIIFNVFFY